MRRSIEQFCAGFPVRAVVLLLSLGVAACDKKTAQDPASPQATAPAPAGQSNTVTPDDDKAFYAMGFDRARGLTPFNLSPHEMSVVAQGFSDAVAGKKALVEIDTQRARINAIRQIRELERAKENKTRGAAFVQAMRSQPKAELTPSGLVYIELLAGTGPQPGPQDRVKVHYKGTLIDGTEFDSSYKHNQPSEFPLWGVIPCWTEGLQKFHVGGKGKLVCPSELAYGDRSPSPLIPAGSTLQFEVEMLEILPPQPAPGTTEASGAATSQSAEHKSAPASSGPPQKRK